jgi:hypothetical protein
MLGISKPDRERLPNCVAPRAPQKSNKAPNLVGQNGPLRARAQNSPFFRPPNGKSAPQKWTFGQAEQRAIGN